MKKGNLLWIGAIGLGLYYLLKKDKNTNDSTILVESTEPTQPTQPTTIANNYTLPFTKKDLLTTNRTIVLTEDVGMTKRMSAVLEYKLPYRGGVMPNSFTQKTSGMWIVRGNLPELKTSTVCKSSNLGEDMFSSMPMGMPFSEPMCTVVATPQAVVDFIFSSNMKWNVKFGKTVNNYGGGMYPPINMDDPIRLTPIEPIQNDSRYRRGLFKTYAFETK